MAYERLNPVDRVPTYAGKVLITPESGEPFYATVTLADEPVVAGTKINALLFDHIEDGLESIEGEIAAHETRLDTDEENIEEIRAMTLNEFYQARVVESHPGTDYLWAGIPFSVDISYAAENARRVLVYFQRGEYCARVEAIKNEAGEYNYHMSGVCRDSGGNFHGSEWAKEGIYQNDLFGSVGGSFSTTSRGSPAFESGCLLSLSSLTFDDDGVYMVISNRSTTDTYLNTTVVVEVY